MSMWSKPTLKVPTTFTVSGSLAMVSASSFSAGQQRMAAAPSARARRSAWVTGASASLRRAS